MALNSNNNNNTPAPSKASQYEIRVMPSKFHQLAKPKGSWSKFLMVALIVALILGLLGLGGYFMYLQLNQASQNAALNLNQAEQVNLNIGVLNTNVNEANLNLPENSNANANVNLELNLNETVNANANTNVNASLNANTNTNAPLGLLTYTSSLDSDSDGLTDVEEDLYQTEKRTADTDGDNYLDAAEIINGYNPKMANGAKLETSGLVNKYSNPKYNYEIFYPTSWLARPEDQSLQSILFITATEEFIKVAVEDNPNKLDIVNWYVQQSPGADLNLLTKITTQFTGVKKYEALVSPDKLTYYILDPNTQDKVYVLSYNLGSLKQINFLATFQMMVNSFKVLTPSPSSP